ncbi:HD domain-containing protein [bacterium]|nr:HD domain-containing protein [bacterium]
MARRPATRSKTSFQSRQPPVDLPASFYLRVFFYSTALLQIVADKGPGVLPVAGGLTLALIIFAAVSRNFVDDYDGRVLAVSAVESVLVSFLIYFAGVAGGILLLPVALAALISIERGQQAGVIFAWVNCVGWLTPTIMDKNLAQLSILGLIYRVAIICSVPFVIRALPRNHSGRGEDDADVRKMQSKALEKAQEAARTHGEARLVQEQELNHERRKLEALMKIAHRMAVLRNPDELLSTIVECAKEQLQVHVAVILLRKGQQLVVEWKEGFTETAAARLNGAIGQGLLGRLAASGESFFYSQADGTEPIRPYWPLNGLEQLIPVLRGQQAHGYQPHSDDLRNFLVVPLQTPIDNAPLGLILVGNRLVGERFSLHDQGYLQILATDAAISIRNLFFLAERERSHDEMIRALAQAIEAKDPYTSGHVTRVCTYSIKLAQAMGLHGNFVKDLNTAAMLHDVGKISTPDSILMKQGPLTDEEFEIMKQHVVHSARIIRDIRSVSAEIQKMVLGHHERWDGKGYPEGLRGEQIPLGAQIMAVADAYDAMTSHRPYRNGLDSNEAMRRLEKGAGTQFNAQVVSYFMALANFTPQENSSLRQLVHEARQKVGANLLRTPAAKPECEAGDSGAQVGAGPAPAGPARRGPDRLELGRDDSRENSR